MYRSAKHSWSGLVGECFIEIGNDTLSADTLWALINHLRDNGHYPSASEDTLNIEVVCSGYSDPGRTYGPPEDCYPPEEDDERELECIELEHWEPGENRPIIVKLPKDLQDAIWEEVEETVNGYPLNDICGEG